jgi:hypothetical protein
MTNDEAMAFGIIVMICMGIIILYIIGQQNDK